MWMADFICEFCERGERGRRALGFRGVGVEQSDLICRAWACGARLLSPDSDYGDEN